jgi:hypothetical protein
MSMNSAPALHSFSSLDAANAAVDALVAAGLPRAAMQVTVLQDEAGPVQGNFLIGNGQTTHGRPPDANRTGLEAPYDENFRQPAYRGGFLLALEGLDEAQRLRAQATLARFDAVAVEDVAAAARPGRG